MNKQYIGIKRGGLNKFESSNLGIVYTLQDDGYYVGHSLTHESITVSKEDILHDLKLGYLKEDNNENKNN